MTSDAVPTPLEIDDLRYGEESCFADPVRGDEKVAAPSGGFEQICDVLMSARAPVIEGEQWRRGNCAECADVAFEFGDVELVDGGVSSWKSAGVGLSWKYNVVVEQGDHGLL